MPATVTREVKTLRATFGAVVCTAARKTRAHRSSRRAWRAALRSDALFEALSTSRHADSLYRPRLAGNTYHKGGEL